jgi:tetraacyldisaccharide 4'-kinase
LRALLTPLAYILSCLYGALSAFHRWIFQSGLRHRQRLPGRTWSVGNIAVGGTGKSPVTVALAKILIESGARPAILTRGYGVPLKRGDSVVLLAGDVLSAATSTQRIPDEARMQSASLPSVPVVVGPDRHAAAMRYMRELKGQAPTHWLLDDGFQHWRLERDLDFVLLDAHNPLPALLPLGRARECPAAISRADIVLFTRCEAGIPTTADLSKVTQHLKLGAYVLTSTMETPAPAESTDGRIAFSLKEHSPVCLVSGIAQPAALHQSVVQLGLAIGTELRLRDHQPIDAAKLTLKCQGQRSILTTAKDYWRDPKVFEQLPLPVFVLDLDVNWDATEMRKALRPFI